MAWAFATSGQSDALLPPQLAEDEGKKVLVLDLDETLVHARMAGMADPDFVLPVVSNGVTDPFVVRARREIETRFLVLVKIN